MADPLSLWRHALDTVALDEAYKLAARQPRCDLTIDQLPNEPNPALSDTIPIWHEANGNTEQVTLQVLGALIGGGGGISLISQTTNFSNFAYNYGYYVNAAGGPGTGANTTAMNTMLAAMGTTTPKGGLVYIPQANYTVNFSGSGFAPQQGTIFWGLGTSGSGVASFPDSFNFSASGDGTLFNCAGPHGYSGTYFYNLSFLASSPTLLTTTAISGNWPNVRVVNCGFQNWPIAVNLSSLGGQFVGNSVQMTNGSLNGATPTTTNGCTIPNTTTGPGFQVLVQANQTLIMGPGEFDNLSNAAANNGAIALAGINNGGPNEHCTIRDYHLADWTWGISYIHSQSSSAAIKATHVSSIHAQCFASCVLMMVPKNNSAIYAEKYVGCTFQKSQGSADGSPIIYVDATTFGSGVSSVDDIEFTNCTVYADANTPASNQYGYNLFTCGNFRIRGGMVSNMGNAGSTSANIAVTGAIGTVTIVGVDLRSNYPQAKNPGHNSQYGLYVIGGNLASNSSLLLDDCVFDNNYAGAPVNVSGTQTTGAEIFIVNSIGYNDQNTLIGTGTTSSTLPITNATPACLAGTLTNGVNYYGPTTVMFSTNSSGAVTFTINGINQTIPASSSYIAYLPKSTDKIQFSSNASTNLSAFNWIGK